MSQTAEESKCAWSSGGKQASTWPLNIPKSGSSPSTSRQTNRIAHIAWFCVLAETRWRTAGETDNSGCHRDVQIPPSSYPRRCLDSAVGAIPRSWFLGRRVTPTCKSTCLSPAHPE